MISTEKISIERINETSKCQFMTNSLYFSQHVATVTELVSQLEIQMFHTNVLQHELILFLNLGYCSHSY